MNDPLVIRCKARLHRRPRSRRRDRPEDIPRVARLLAFALHFELLLRQGEVQDLAELARLAGLSRARLTQIMNLRLLAPDIQQAILFLPPASKGRDRITERHLRPIAAQSDWRQQQRLWSELQGRLVDGPPDG